MLKKDDEEKRNILKPKFLISHIFCDRDAKVYMFGWCIKWFCNIVLAFFCEITKDDTM